MADFLIEAERLLRHEGGKANDPDDKGGLTYYGISEEWYPEFHKDPTPVGAIGIYKNDFWNAVHGNDIKTQNIAGSMVDFALTSGPRTAIKTAQMILLVQFNCGVTVDGIMGPFTLAFLNSVDQERLLALYTVNRTNFYGSLVLKDATQGKFLHSWLTRTAEYLA
jgi:lysozyme family protein